MPSSKRISDMVDVGVGGGGLLSSHEFIMDTPSATFKTSLNDMLGTQHDHDLVDIVDVSDIGGLDISVGGNWDFLKPAFKTVSLGNISGSVGLDLGVGCVFVGTVVGDVTFTLSNNSFTGSSAKNMMLVLYGGGAYTITWPSEFKWSGGVSELTLESVDGSSCDILTFVTVDNGVSWLNLGLATDVK